ncbi:MAG: DUF4249 domain-containing protein [Bacteroidales bacterium]
MRSQSFCFLLVILFTSCTQEINLKQSDTIQYPVMSGLISPDRNSNIYLGKTLNILGQTQEVLEWTNIELRMNGIRVIGFRNQDLSLITIPADVLIEGSSYQIMVNLADGTEVSANDTIPVLVRIDQAEKVIGKTYDAYGTPHSDYSMTFTDPADIRNYYELLIFTQRWMDTLILVGYHHNVEIADPVIQAEGILDYNPASFVFSDDLFNGRSYTLNMKMKNEGLAQVSLHEPMINAGNGTFLVLRSVSKTYYDFRKSWILHRRTQNRGAFNEEPLATILIGNPTPLYSNITNGYGIFAAYSQDFIQVEMKKWQ